MATQELTVLSPSDRKKLEQEIMQEVKARLGDRPTLATVKKEMNDDRFLRGAINAVHGLGRFTGVLMREGISAVGALALLVGFAVLEAERIYTGMMQLDQAQSAAIILAGGLVLANITLPIYRLRRQRTGDHFVVQRWTVRSQIEALGQRIFGKATQAELDINHNSTLRIAEIVVLLATLFLAFYAVMGGTMQQYADLPWYMAIVQSVGGTFDEFVPVVIGLAVSIGGVFMLQSVSHEVAVRAIEERPEQEQEVLKDRQLTYADEVAAIRGELTDRYMAAKVADKRRKPVVDKRIDNRVVNIDKSTDKPVTWDDLTPKERQVVKHLMDNPADTAMTVRDLSTKLKINRTTVNKGLRFQKQNAAAVSNNGHSLQSKQ